MGNAIESVGAIEVEEDESRVQLYALVTPKRVSISSYRKPWPGR